MVAPPPLPGKSSPSPPNDRRATQRIRLKTDVSFAKEGQPIVETDVDLDTGSNFYWGLLDDISEGGVFVATDYLPKRQSKIHLRFSLPDGGNPITVLGEVRWFREESSRDSPVGFGIRFVDLPAPARARISDFIERRDPLFYDD